MRNWILILMLCVRSVFGADKNISAVSISPDGWNAYITIDNMTSGGSFRIKHGINHTHVDSTPYLLTKRWGFDNTDGQIFVYDTVYIDSIVNKRTPNTASDSTYADGSNLVACAVLSDFITVDDTVKEVWIPRHFYRKDADTTATYTATSLTNNSVATYPLTFGKIEEPDRQRHQGSTFTLKAKCGSYWGRNGRPVRSVMFRVIDQHGNGDSCFVTQTTAIKNKFTYPKTDSVVDEFYIGTINNTVFTQGDTLKCDMYAYPWVGKTAQVLKTNDGLFDENSPNYHTLIHLCDKTGAYGTAVACVDTLNGVDASGAVTNAASFDKANPPNKYKTISGALNACATYNNTNYGHNDVGGSVIYCYTDVVWMGGTVTTANTAAKTYCTIRPAPDTAFYHLKLKRQNGSKGTRRIKIVGMKIDTAIAAGYFSGTQFRWIDSCDIDIPANLLFYQDTTTYLTNNIIRRVNNGIKPYGGYNQFPIVTGNYFYGTGGSTQIHSLTGNILDSLAGDFGITDSIGAYKKRFRGAFTEKNKFIRYNGAGTRLFSIYYYYGDSAGWSISGNLFENKNYATPAQPLVWIAADGSLGTYLSNVVVDHNSITGWRANSFYNDQGTTTLYRTFIRRTNNIYEDDNIKADDFGTFNANRVGNWSVMYGVGSYGNVNAESEVGADGFLYRFPGASSIQRPALDATGNDPAYLGFVDRKAFVGGTTENAIGGGDYHLQSNSPAIGIAKGKYYSYDLDGKQFWGNAAGAYEYGSATKQFSLTITSPHGSVTLSPSGGTYDSATEVTLTPVPATGYVFSGWSGDLTGSANPASITMDGNKSVTANFKSSTVTTNKWEAFKAAFTPAFRRAFR